MDRDKVIGHTIGMVIMILFASFLLGAGYFWETYVCNSAWKLSGMKSEYSVVNGCMLEVTPGKWIPADTYRNVD